MKKKELRMKAVKSITLNSAGEVVEVEHLPNITYILTTTGPYTKKGQPFDLREEGSDAIIDRDWPHSSLSPRDVLIGWAAEGQKRVILSATGEIYYKDWHLLPRDVRRQVVRIAIAAAEENQQ